MKTLKLLIKTSFSNKNNDFMCFNSSDDDDDVIVISSDDDNDDMMIDSSRCDAKTSVLLDAWTIA